MNHFENATEKYFQVYLLSFSNIMFVSTGALCIHLRGFISDTVLTIAFRDLQGMCNGLCSLLHGGREISETLLSMQKIFNLEKAPQELPVSPAGSTEITPPSDWPTKGAIEFKNVDLRYRPNNLKALSRLSFKAEAGHKIGVVGRSGCGKSTMCLALTRIVEICGGTVLVDGVEVSKVNLDKVREKITVIPQDPVIFEGTIKFNLDP